MAYGQPYYGYYPQFNNGATPDMLAQYKGQYQQPMQMPVQQVPQAQASTGMLFVLNENEATSYPVAPNNTVILWDKNEPTIYIKSANAQGVPSMRVLDFSERSQSAPAKPAEHTCRCGDRFVTKEQFEELKSKYEEILAVVEKLNAKTAVRASKTTEVE